MIKYLDLHAINMQYEPLLSDAIRKVAQGGWYLHGAELERFEKAFAAYTHTGHCVGVANGLDALTLILMALKDMHGWDEGDEVVVPAMTFFATALAVERAGLHPVFCDVRSDTYLMDVASAEQKLTSRTRAFLPVHLYGRMADMSAISTLAESHGLVVVEDAAQAHGAKDASGHGPAHEGIAAAYSFYPGKNLGALGDAGAVVTNCGELAIRVRTLANYGAEEKYRHTLMGLNSRMDEIQAAALNVKLPYLERENEIRRQQASLYANLLSKSGFMLPYNGEVPEGAVFHVYPVCCDDPEMWQKKLAQAGIQTGRHYPLPLHWQPAYAQQHADEDYPVSQHIARHELSLPIGSHLTDEDIQKVAETINNNQ